PFVSQPFDSPNFLTLTGFSLPFSVSPSRYGTVKNRTQRAEIVFRQAAFVGFQDVLRHERLAGSGTRLGDYFRPRGRRFDGPFARRSASSSTARSSVSDSTASPARRLAFVSPSVTYGPNRPSLTTTGRPDEGSCPSSRNGAFAAARPRRCFGAASSAFASSSVIEKIW